MAGWLSSKLKEAENFLQQIDQQAAESLGKPDTEKRDGSTKGKRGFQGNKPVFDLSLADQKDMSQETHVRSNVELGSEPAPSALSKLIKKSDQGARISNGNARSVIKGSSSYRKKQLDAAIQGEANSEINAGKDDWTELLASPNVDKAPSPALASSVGSSDSGHNGFIRKPPSKSRLNLNRKGHHQQSYDTLSGDFSRGPSMNLKISPSTSSSSIKDTDSQHVLLSGRFGDETVKRRLEIDLAGLMTGAEVGAETLKNQSSKNSDIYGRPSDSGNSLQVVEGLHEIAEEDRVNGARPLQEQREHPNIAWKQGGGPSSAASQCVDHSADHKDDTSHVTHPATLGRFYGDSFEGIHGMEKQDISGQNEYEDGPRNAVSESPLAVHSRESAMPYEFGELEELLGTRALPGPLQAEEDSYESTSMSEEDSDVGTESEEEEEIERRKSAHKKRIAKRMELTAARAAQAQAAIRERKLLVQKLENEVSSLQRVLAEREEQQGKEAAELRRSIAEVMQALEAEKKLHSSTRMKALAVESELENKNADLAKSLGALQWEVEEEMSQIVKARRMIDTKMAMKADLERRLAKVRGDGCLSGQNEEIKLVDKPSGVDLSFEEEQSDLWKKIQECQIQVKDLEVKICGLKDTWHLPTETEKELEIRLAQMTDYLIQKQAQVEALSAERATLLIRLENLTKAIEEERAFICSQASRNKHGQRNLDWDFNYYDMEYGLGGSYGTKLKPLAHENGESSARGSSMISSQFSPVLRQLNGFVSAGMFYLRKHRWAQAFTVMYIIILHVWVWFILFMNSKSAQTLALQELGLPKNVSELKNGSNVTNLL